MTEIEQLKHRLAMVLKMTLTLSESLFIANNLIKRLNDKAKHQMNAGTT
jgi:hypothetical protein